MYAAVEETHGLHPKVADTGLCHAVSAGRRDSLTSRLPSQRSRAIDTDIDSRSHDSI